MKVRSRMALAALLAAAAAVGVSRWLKPAAEESALDLPTPSGPQHSGAYHKVVLESDQQVDGRYRDTLEQPVEHDIAPDGSVYFIERFGKVSVWRPSLGHSVLLAKLEVHRDAFNTEEGLLGIALDPRFEANGWLYLQYSLPGLEPGEFGHQTGLMRVARFRVVGDRLDLGSEQVLIEARLQREMCCHAGGSLAFDAEGNLYIGIGENGPPSAGLGWAPIDERPGHELEDSQRTAGNTNDLRGKILRIHPEADGSYTIPAGNLFTPGTPRARPEIYVMGTRNPFSISIDPRARMLYFGEPGPDAGKPPNTVREQVRELVRTPRGPAGYDEINQVPRAGNHGWPYFIARNFPYLDFDFANETLGPPFDPEHPINDSPHNTGLRELPPAQPALIYYPTLESEEFPEVGLGGRVAIAGPVHYYDPDRAPGCGLGPELDHVLLIADWQRSWIIAVHLDDEERALRLERFLPEMTFNRPIDLKLGPDGCLYLIEWGSTWGLGNLDSQIVRIEYRP